MPERISLGSFTREQLTRGTNDLTLFRAVGRNENQHEFVSPETQEKFISILRSKTENC